MCHSKASFNSRLNTRERMDCLETEAHLAALQAKCSALEEECRALREECRRLRMEERRPVWKPNWKY